MIIVFISKNFYLDLSPIYLVTFSSILNYIFYKPCILYISYLTVATLEIHISLSLHLLNSADPTQWSLCPWIFSNFFLLWAYIWLDIICKDPERLHWWCLVLGRVYVFFSQEAEAVTTLGTLKFHLENEASLQESQV